MLFFLANANKIKFVPQSIKILNVPWVIFKSLIYNHCTHKKLAMQILWPIEKNGKMYSPTATNTFERGEIVSADGEVVNWS